MILSLTAFKHLISRDKNKKCSASKAQFFLFPLIYILNSSNEKKHNNHTYVLSSQGAYFICLVVLRPMLDLVVLRPWLGVVVLRLWLGLLPIVVLRPLIGFGT